MILFFEKYSIVQVLCLFRDVKKAKSVYFHYAPFSSQRQNPALKKIVKKIVRFLNKNAELGALDIEIVREHCWMMNKKAIELVDDLAPEIEKSKFFGKMSSMASENILKCYKAYLVQFLASRCLFFSLAKDLAFDNDARIIPASAENGFLQDKLFVKENLDKNIPRGINLINKAADMVGKCAILLMLSVLPMGFLILKSRKITLKRNIAKKYDVAMPVVWGFHEMDNLLTGVRRPHKDDYLYGEYLRPGQIVHIFSYWRYDSEIERRFRSIMDKSGIAYIDKKQYRLTPGMFLRAIKIQISIASGLVSSGFYVFEKTAILMLGCKIIHHILDSYLELENVDYSVYFSKQDYSLNHIVHTIICNSLGKKTVGIQHAASPYDFPQLCYVHFDNYIVFGDTYIEAFAPHWQRIRLSKVGRESLDFITNILQDDVKIQRLKERFKGKFTERKFTAVFALAGNDPDISAKAWDTIYRGLNSLRGLDIDFNLFLRFRESNLGYMRNFEGIAREDKRIIIDYEYFTIYELMALCDLFIGCASSFTINEAIASKAKVFTFDIDGRTKHLYGDYGKDFIIDDPEDFVKVFSGLKNNFKDFDCDWELLRKKSNFNYDGKNHGRIQRVVYDTLQEVKAGKICLS